MLEGVEFVFGLGKGARRRQEGDFRAGAFATVADHLERRLRLAVGKAHVVLLAVLPDLEFQRLRKRVDDRDADAVQAARDLVGVLIELPAGVQLGHDHLGRRNAFLPVNADRNPPTVVAHRHGTIAVQDHLDGVAIAGERLVDRVVHHLVDHVVQAGTVFGVADIHARPLAHGVEPAQDLDRLGIVGIGCAVVR
jgi:hypothetical protein